MEYYQEIDQLFLKHGASEELYSPDKDELSPVLKAAAAPGIKFIPIVQRHMGSDKTPPIINSIKDELEEKGIIFLMETEVLEINVDKKLGGAMLKSKEEEFEVKCSYLITAPGRIGAKWLSD